jgi:hypothetical protein
MWFLIYIYLTRSMGRFECFYVVTIKFKSVSKRIPKGAPVIKVYTLIKEYNKINTHLFIAGVVGRHQIHNLPLGRTVCQCRLISRKIYITAALNERILLGVVIVGPSQSKILWLNPLHFWNNLHQVCSKKIILKSLGARKPKGLSRITAIG